MPTDPFDRYVALASFVHRLDPRVKLGATLAFVVSNLLLPDGAWLAFGLSWGLVLFVGWLAAVGPWFAVKRSFVALPFALAAVSVIFALPGQPLFAWSVGPWTLVGTETGVVRFASIVLRSWLSVQMAILLAATTRMPDLLHALRHFRVPTVIIQVVGLMYRYLAVLSEETTRLLRARQARSARGPSGGGGSVVWRARVAGHMAGQLFLRSYDRSERVYSAMLARGYRGQPLTLTHHVMQARDWRVVAALGAALLLLQVIARMRLA